MCNRETSFMNNVLIENAARANHTETFARNPLKPLIEQIAARLAQEPGVEQIILYGSQATGEAHADSDIDLFIVNRSSDKSRLQRLAREKANDYQAVQSFVFTPDRVRERLERGDQFIQQILERGVELYREDNYQSDKEWLASAKQRKHSFYPLDWLRVAEKDWKRVLQRLVEGDEEDAAFHLQQALEKYLKAFLLTHGWELQKTHETTKLLREAVKHEARLAPFIALSQRIEQYYLEERYPAETHELELTHENVSRALHEMENLRAIILEKINARLPQSNVEK